MPKIPKLSFLFSAAHFTFGINAAYKSILQISETVRSIFNRFVQLYSNFIYWNGTKIKKNNLTRFTMAAILFGGPQFSFICLSWCQVCIPIIMFSSDECRSSHHIRASTHILPYEYDIDISSWVELWRPSATLVNDKRNVTELYCVLHIRNRTQNRWIVPECLNIYFQYFHCTSFRKFLIVHCLHIYV